MKKANKKFGVLTLSDKGYAGKRIDTAGKFIIAFLKKTGMELKKYGLLPDDKNKIKNCLIDWCDKLKLNLLITTGGTGLSSRDNTALVTKKIIDKEAIGISEYLRYASYKINPFGALSNGVSGIRKKTLIINLPGSERAVRELMPVLKKIIPHALEIIEGKTEHKRC